MHSKVPHAEEECKLWVPSPASLNLGMPPRVFYPLVIFLIRNDLPNYHPDETVSYNLETFYSIL